MSAVTIQQMAERVTSLMEERLRVKGTGLHEKLRKGGRLLPRKFRIAADRLADASEMSKNPKLLMRIDEAAVVEAYDICSKHLTKIDAAHRRMTGILGTASSLAATLLFVGLIVMGVLYWRGYI